MPLVQATQASDDASQSGRPGMDGPSCESVWDSGVELLIPSCDRLFTMGCFCS